MTIHVARVPMPRCAFEQIHVALYGYFPQSARDAERPFVWRVGEGGKAIYLASALRPTTPSMEATIEAGRSYEFSLTYKRVRNCKSKPIEIVAMPEMRERLIKWAADRGGDVGFVRLENPRAIHAQKHQKRVRLPIVDAYGSVFVRDAEAFERALVDGGPGTGKVYGLGMWWLDAIYAPLLQPDWRAAS